jgi:hypothetical protein
MKNFVLLLFVFSFCFALESNSKGEFTGPVLLEVHKIWDQAPHNAFTDLIRYKKDWFCTFREGERHVYGQDGKIRIITSKDGQKWESAALLEEKGVDLRDPKLSVTPDGRLMLVMGGSVYKEKELVTRQPRVAFSNDGKSWSNLIPVMKQGDWLWRVTWFKGMAYGTSYSSGKTERNLKLYRSTDGTDWQPVTVLKVDSLPNETTLRFLPDGEMIALVRREAGNKFAWIGHSKPPYTDWTWHETGYRVGGPNFIIIGDEMWAGCRNHVPQTKTVLARFSKTNYEPVLDLPSNGDSSYPGMVWFKKRLWMSYYSSHEGKTSIYLAKIKLP